MVKLHCYSVANMLGLRLIKNLHHLIIKSAVLNKLVEGYRTTLKRQPRIIKAKQAKKLWMQISVKINFSNAFYYTRLMFFFLTIVIIFSTFYQILQLSKRKRRAPS